MGLLWSSHKKNDQNGAKAGQFPFDRLVKIYGFCDINQAIADARRGKTIKPVLRISQA